MLGEKERGYNLVSLTNPLKGERDYEKRDETLFVLDRAGPVGR